MKQANRKKIDLYMHIKYSEHSSCYTLMLENDTVKKYTEGF